MIFCEADLRNGAGDGFSLCGQVRADPRTADLPVVLLARSPESFHRELAGGAGADQYLPKPLFLNDVVALARLMAGRSSSAARFDAETDRLSLPQLLRALLSGVRAGRIELERSRAFITFREGRIVDAGCDGLRGEDALNRILLLESGAYGVSFGPSLTRATMTLGLEDFCRRTMPRVARWQKLLERSVPLEARLVVDFARLRDALSQLPEEVNAILRLFDGRRAVRDVVLESSLDEVTALEVVTRLYAMAVLAPAAREPERPVASSAPSFFEPAPVSASYVAELESARPSDLDAPGLTAVASEPEFPASLFEAGGSLDADMLRQLEAFRIKSVMDRPGARAIQAPALELAEFARGESSEGLASEMSSVLAEARTDSAPAPELAPGAVTPKIALVRTIEPAAPAPASGSTSTPAATPLTRSVEDEFFSRGEEAAPATVPQAHRRSWTPIFGAMTGLVIATGASIAVWSARAPVAREPLAGTVKLMRAASEGAEVARRNAVAAPAVVPVAATALETRAPAKVEPAFEAVEIADGAARALAEATALYEAHRYREAIAALDEITAADPNIAQAWLLLGLARFDGGDSAGAESSAMKALSLDPKNGRALVLLATIYLDRGQKQEAQVELRRYLELYPNGPFAREARELLGR